MEKILALVTTARLLSLLRGLIILGVGLLLAKIVASSLPKLLEKYTNPQQVMLVRRLSYYFIAGLAIASALTEVGFDLKVLLGAAGIITVAVGFASQTSASNLISGLFLIGERPFVVGDVIRVGTTVGEVLAIDLLSVKLRTFDNLFVRLPNEYMVKSEIVNLTYFPIRRIDLVIGVDYKSDIARVREVLNDVAYHNPLCLEEPKPLFIFDGFGEASLKILFCVWTRRENFLDLKNSIQEEIKAAFEQHGISMPFPHRTLVTGPIPVQVVSESAVKS